jgi:hypothetical protein
MLARYPPMDLREQVMQAIAVLQRLAHSRGPKRRGRPPGWMTAASKGKRRGRALGSKNKTSITSA